jgi:predicted glycosyltransferase
VFTKPTNFPSHKKVLYCCLNWGLGHATRSVPVIERLIEAGNQVSIASDGLTLDYLQKEFPDLTVIYLPSYGIAYPYSSFLVNMIMQSFKIRKAIYQENKHIRLLHEINIYDAIISDNRPGCFHNGVPSVYITHQLVPFHHNKWVAALFYQLHHYYYKKFTAVWIPDDQNVKLSGSLSDCKFDKQAVRFIGIYSRLKKDESKKREALTVVLSGPEPQRTNLENLLYAIIKQHYTGKVYFVRGSNLSNKKIISTQFITVFNLLTQYQLQDILNSSKLVISRSGYTTLMDLYELGLNAIVIPTPGQTEQEYLGKRHNERWTCIPQKEVSIRLPIVLSKI